MSWLWVLRALAGHWRRHPLQLAALLVGLAVATALWSGVQALNAEARASYDRAARLLAANEQAAVLAADGRRFALEHYATLRRAGWPVSPVLEGEVTAGGRRLQVVGIDPLTLPPATGLPALAGDDAPLAGFLAGELALAAPGTLADVAGAEALPPLAAEPTLAPETLVVDMALAQRLLDADGQVSRLLLPADEAGRALPGDLAGRLRVAPAGETGDLDRMTDSFHLNLTAFGFLSFVVGLFIVYSAIGLAFEQRRPVFRTLRACGVSARGLALVLTSELVVLALASGLIGVAAGYVIAAALLPDVAASLRGLYGARVSGSLTLAPAWWLSGLAMSLIGAFAAAGGCLWRAWRLPVLAPAQPQAWAAAEWRGLRWRAVAAAVLGLGALAMGAFGEGLAAGFGLMGALLLAAALALPVLLAGILAVGGRLARRPVAEWAWADARLQLGGLSLALMALLLALGVNIGVGTMVDSFRRTFTGWLDQRLAAEIYLTADDAAQAREIGRWLEGRPEVTARLPIWDADIRFRDWPTELYGFRDHATYRDSWPVLAAAPDAWDAVARGDAVLVSEQLARRFGLELGETIRIPAPDAPWEVQVAGIYSDYGNPEGQIMVAVDQLAARWPGVDRREWALRVTEGSVEPLLRELRARFGLDERQAVDQAAIKAVSQRMFERTFAVTVALNGLTLAVAGIALLASLLTLANIRLAQLAPLWAMGVTRRRLAAIELGKTVALAALTALAALPLGLAVAWVLTHVINVRAFGWQLPMYLFPAQWAALGLLALATAALAALPAVLQLQRTTPARLLQGFSNER